MMSLELDQFYQQMQLEQEMHYMTSVTDVVTAFEYHGVESVLSFVFDKHPNFKNEVIQYLDKEKVLT
jgi:hypothetical protein